MKRNCGHDPARVDLAPCGALDDDCCITAAHHADEQCRRRPLTEEERKEVARSLDKLRNELGLAPKVSVKK
jgi:hypothetical protein